MDNCKNCKKCGKIKNVTKFNKNKNYKDGLQIYCRACVKEYKRQDYIKNKEKISIKHAEYYLKHKEEIRFQQNKNKEARKIKAFEYRSKPEIKEKIALRLKKYRSRPEVRSQTNINIKITPALGKRKFEQK